MSNCGAGKRSFQTYDLTEIYKHALGWVSTHTHKWYTHQRIDTEAVGFSHTQGTSVPESGGTVIRHTSPRPESLQAPAWWVRPSHFWQCFMLPLQSLQVYGPHMNHCFTMAPPHERLISIFPSSIKSFTWSPLKFPLLSKRKYYFKKPICKMNLHLKDSLCSITDKFQRLRHIRTFFSI